MSKSNKKIHKKKTIIIVLIIIVILIGIVVSKVNKYKNEQEEDKVTTEKIEKRTIVSSISATGTIKSSDTKEFTTTLVGSEVKSVNVKVGDKVNVGDNLLTFNTDSLNDSLNLAQEGLNIAKQQSDLSVNAAQKGVNTAADTRNYQYSSLDSGIQDIEKNIKEIDNQIATVQNAIKPLQTAESLAKSNLNTVTSANQPIINEYNAKKQEYSNSLLEYEKAKAECSDLEVKYNQYFSSAGQLDPAGKIIDPQDYEDNGYATAEHRTADQNLTAGRNKLTELEAKVGSVKVSLDALENTFINAQGLIDNAQNQYNSAVSNLQSAQAGVAELTTAKAQLEAQYKQAKDTAVTTKKSLDSALDNAALSLNSSILTGRSSILTQENQIKTVKDQIEKGIINSDVSGTVTAVNVNEGDIYQGGTLIKVEGCETFIVEAQIDEYDIADIEVGMKVKIKTDATRDEELDGRVTFVSPSATEATPSVAMTGMTSTSTGDATYKVEIAIDSINDRLRIGMNAKLSIITKEAEDALAVPYDAIEEKEDGKSVIKILEDDGVTEKEIEVTKGLESDYYTEIKSNSVKEGMDVIVPDTASGDALSNLINTMQTTSGF